jgi:hypothetical protein
MPGGCRSRPPEMIGCSVRHGGVLRIATSGDGSLRNDGDVVKLWSDPTSRAGTPSRLNRCHGGLANIIRPHPERQPDDGSARHTHALIDPHVSGLLTVSLREEGEATEHRGNALRVAILSKEINADPPEVCPASDTPHRQRITQFLGTNA